MLNAHILPAVQQNAVGGRTVAPGAPGLLIVAFQILGHIVVDHIAHIGFVDAHAEGVGGHHDLYPVKQKILLVLLALGLLQPGVIAPGGNAVALQQRAHLLHRFAGGAVDNAAAVALLANGLQQGGGLAFGAAHLKIQVGPVKPGHQNFGILQLQRRNNILPHPVGGGGGKGAHQRALRQGVQKIRNAQIPGAKILAPLADAVRLVHRDHINGSAARPVQKAVGVQPLRRYIHDLIAPLGGACQHGALLPRGKRAV